MTKKQPKVKPIEIVEATRNLHALVYRAYHQDDVTIQEAADRLHELRDKSMRDGDDLEGWDGSCLNQADACIAIIDLLECFGAK